jgi:hypothetical protein
MKYTIFFDLHKNRMMPGKASIVDANGEVKLGPWPCLGCCDSTAAAAHGNPGCDPLQPWGNTPTGDYAIAGLLNHGTLEANLHSYGPWDTLMLVGTTGDARTATNGAPPDRTGIEAHAGDPSSTGGLRVTHGCLRSSNADQKPMVDFIKNAGIVNFTVRVTES